MCFPKPNVPSAQDQANEAARLEAERAARVRDTSDVVNKTFDDKYGPQYYKGIGDSYRAYAQPLVGEQFSEANRATKFRFANNASSSAANRTAADLYRDKLRADSNVENAAQDAVTGAKSDIEAKRGGLISLAEAGAGLENTAAQARGFTPAPPAFSPIGDLFGKYANTLSVAARAADNGRDVGPYQKPVDFLRGGSKGSQRVI